MAATDNGLIHLSSKYSVDETVKRLEDLLQAQGIKEFCRVDHSGEAEKAGLKMRPTKVVIFGNPKGGTPLMLAAPSVAIGLPLKALIGKTMMAKSGFRTTVWNIFNSGTTFRKT